MNSKLNHIPGNVKKIHMIAACGTAMGALASMLHDMGYDVTGSDYNIYPPMSDFLMEKGIKLFKGFDKNNLHNNPDLVIVGNAVVKDNPEAVEMVKKKIPFCSMPQAVNRFAAADKKIILVTGTHGKTTTSSIIAHILNCAGLDPSFMIGGILKNFNSNYRIGKGDYIVIEGDEYDTAFFDKGPKFMHYDPFITIITGVEFDHADIFTDLNHVKQIFKDFIKKLSKDSLAIVCGDDENLKQLLDYKKCRMEKYGLSTTNHWSFDNFKVKSGKSVFNLKNPGGKKLEIVTPMMGRHNILNILAAAGVAEEIGISGEYLVKAMATFAGVKRRQEIRGVKNGITVMDDFAHHPTAVKETIAAVRPFFPDGRIIAVFEPRTNSSMRNVFQNIYPSSFCAADLVCIRKPSRIDKIDKKERIAPEKLAADIRAKGVDCFYFEDTDSIIDFLCKHAEKGDLLLIMSNGGFDNIHDRLLERL